MSGLFDRSASLELPLTLLALAFFLASAFQTVQLVHDSETLATIDRSQDLPLQETARLRQAADALATDISQLAQSGNANAKAVVDEMARQNVLMRPTQSAAPDAGTSPK